MKGRIIHTNYLLGILFALSFLLYSRTLNYEFLWDDQRSHLTQHEDLMNGNLKALWKKPYDGMYIPLTYSTWYLIKTKAYNQKTHFLDPKPFHFANIFMHSINGILVFLLLLLLFGNKWACFVGSLLFIVHPLQVESVAWISEFRGLYSCFFGLLSLYILLQHIGKNRTDKFSGLIRSKAFIASTIFFICALLSKPSAVVFPFITGIIVWCFYPESLKTVVKVLLIWLVFFIPIAIITGQSQPNDILPFVTPLSERIFIFCYSTWFYITKFTMPLKLVAAYGETPQQIIENSWLYIFSFIIIGLSVFLFLKREKFRYLFTSYSIFLIAILPVSGIIAFSYQRYSNVADRYMYLPMIGAAILLAHLWKNTEQKKYFKYIISIYLVIYFILSIKQIPTWKNEYSMWDNAMKNYPHQFMAAYNRGVQFGKMQKWQDAVDDYSVAITFNAKDKNTYVNRGNALSMLNRYDEAMKDYTSAIKIDSNDGSIYYNRALTNFYMGNLISCTKDVKKAQSLRFKIDKNFIMTLNNEIRKEQNRHLKRP